MTIKFAPIKSICVYCGSQPSLDPAYRKAAQRLGRAMASEGFIHTAHLVRPLVIDKIDDIIPEILAQAAKTGHPKGTDNLITRM